MGVRNGTPAHWERDAGEPSARSCKTSIFRPAASTGGHGSTSARHRLIRDASAASEVFVFNGFAGRSACGATRFDDFIARHPAWRGGARRAAGVVRYAAEVYGTIAATHRGSVTTRASAPAHPTSRSNDCLPSGMDDGSMVDNSRTSNRASASWPGPQAATALISETQSSTFHHQWHRAGCSATASSPRASVPESKQDRRRLGEGQMARTASRGKPARPNGTLAGGSRRRAC